MTVGTSVVRTREFLRRHRYIILGCLYGFVFVIGVIGWMQSDHSLGPINAAYRSLGLFVMATGDERNPALLLNVARFAAPILAAYTILAVIFRVIASQRDLSRAQGVRGGVLVLGDGPLALETASRFLDEGRTVLLIGTGPDEVLVPLRDSGLVQLDAVDDIVLRRLTQRAEQVVVRATTDAETAVLARRIREVRDTADTPVHILFEDPGLATAWRREFHEHVIGIPTHVATTLLRQDPPLPDNAVAPPPIVVGGGPVAGALVRRIVTAWQQPGEKIEIHVVGRSRDWVDEAVAGLEHRVDLRWHQMTLHPVFVARLVGQVQDEWLPPDRADRYQLVGSRVYVAYDDGAESAPLALDIARHAPSAHVTCLVDDPSLWYRNPRANRVRYYSATESVTDPKTLQRNITDDIVDEIEADSDRWPSYEPSPSTVLSAIRGAVPNIPMVIAEQRDAVFIAAGLRLSWSHGVDGATFVASPEQLNLLARQLCEVIGISVHAEEAEVRSASLFLASRLPTLIARTGARIVPLDSAPASFGAEQIDHLARLAHETYLSTARASANVTGSVNALRTWEELAEFERRSNIAQAADVPLKLARIDMTVRAVPIPRTYVFTHEELELLAKHEHRRWEQFQNGNGRRGHVFNVPWDELSDDIREYDRRFIRELPQNLASIGLEIVPVNYADTKGRQWIEAEEEPPHPDGAEYQRVGLAWAWPLESDVKWETPRGDILTGSVGDWWVVSEDGASRTVAPEAFAATYTSLGGQVYRRIGTIRARQVRETERVETLEGPAHAMPRDWIATSPRGERWPIPAEQFLSLYAPVLSGGADGT